MRDELHQLIKSLTKSEKRYFTLHASMHRKEGRHVALYKAIDAQKVYDEEALRRMFRQKGYGEQISEAKHYLQRLIMKVLRGYHSDISQNAQVKDLLREVEILRIRGLYELSEKTLARAAEIAETNNFYHYMMEVNYWRRDLLMAQQGKGTSREMFEKEHEKFYLDKKWLLREMNAVNTCSYAFDILKIAPPVTTPEAADALTAKMPELVLNGQLPSDASYFAQANLIYTRANYFLSVNDFLSHYHAIQEFIELAEHSPWLEAEQSGHLAAGLEQMLRNLTYRERYFEAVKVLDRFRGLIRSEWLTDRPGVQAAMVNSLHGYTLTVDLGLGNVQAAVERIPTIIVEMEGFRKYLIDEDYYALYFEIALVAFGKGTPSDALPWIEPMLNHGPRSSSVYQDILYSAVRMLHLILHYELGNQDLLYYLLKSYYRFLGRRKERYGAEDIVYRFLQGALRIGDQREIVPLFEKLAAELRAIRYNPYECHIFAEFNLLAWTESRIEKRPFAEIMRRYALIAQKQENFTISTYPQVLPIVQ